MNSLIKKHHQSGASLVEMSMTIMIFIVIVMAIIEFSMLVFTWARAVEATRAGVRYAAVNTPVVDLSALDCSNSESSVITTGCGAADCAGLLQQMQGMLPGLEGNNVEIEYRCSGVGNPQRPVEMLLPTIAVSITGMQFEFMSAGMFGIDASLTMPDFSAVRTGEDMYTTASE